MKVGVIGFGKMGMLHAGIVNGMAGHEVVAVAENSDFVVQSLKALTPNLRLYADYREMLDREALDAVFITTPVFAHVDMCLECVKRGTPFFVEKPLALNAADAKRLADALQARPTVNMVGYMMRYIGTFAKGREIVAGGALGEIISFNVAMHVSQLFKSGKGWRYDKTKSGGGLVMGPTSHVIDLMMSWLGPVKGVNAFALDYYSKTTEDFIHVMYHLPSGAKGWLDSSWSVRGRRLVESKMEVHGANGMLVVTDDTVKLLLDADQAGYAKGWTILRKPELFQSVSIDIGGPQYTLEVEDFLRGVAAKRSPECTVGTSYEVHKVIDAIYDSAANDGAYREVR